MHVDEHQCQTLPLGQAIERLSYVQAGLRGAVVVPQVADVVLSETGGWPVSTEPIKACVDDDAVQPGGHRGIAAKRTCPAVCREEGVLHTVSRQLAVAAHPHRNRPHAVLVSAEELAKGVWIACTVRGDQLVVGAAIETHRSLAHLLTWTSETWARNLPSPSGPSLVTYTMTSWPVTGAPFALSTTNAPFWLANVPSALAPSSEAWLAT